MADAGKDAFKELLLGSLAGAAPDRTRYRSWLDGASHRQTNFILRGIAHPFSATQTPTRY